MNGTAPLPSPDLTGSDAARLNSVIDRVVAARAAVAKARAEEAAAMADAMRLADERRARIASRDSRETELPVREIAAEIAAAARMSDRTVRARLGEAHNLVTRFPATWNALAAAEIDDGHVWQIVRAGDHIDDHDARTTYETAILTVARRECPARLRPIALTLAQRLHPRPLAERHRAAAELRDVRVRDLDDGLSELIASLPSAIAHGILDRISTMARTVRDDRRRGEVRADVLAALLLTGHATVEDSELSAPEQQAIRAEVHITMQADVLTGASSAPADLAGVGPIDPDTARRLAAVAPTWVRLFTSPLDGHIVRTDRYRPLEAQRRTLAARDEHCRFPGCRQPAHRSDLDHTVAAEHGGPTALGNLAHLCRSHHVLKHHTAWRVRQRPGGVLEWTSPTGRVHPDVPGRTLVFTAAVADAADPPPF